MTKVTHSKDGRRKAGLFYPKYTPDWEFFDDIKTSTECYAVDMYLEEPYGSLPKGRIAAFPKLDKAEMDDPDAHVFLVASALEAIGKEMIANIPENKVQHWIK